MGKYLIIRTDTKIVKGCARHTDRVMKRLHMPDVDDSVVGSYMRQFDDIVMTARGYCRVERRGFYITIVDAKGQNIWGCDVEGTHY